MSRRKYPKTLPHAAASAPDSGGGTAVMEPLGFGGNYVGATTAPSRGYLEWSTLNTRYDLNACDQREMVRRSRSLVANSGIARVLVTIAMMVGSQVPQMASADAGWDKVAEQLLRFENGSAMICDLAGTHNLETVQRLIEFLAMRDGDCFIVLTKTRTGRASWRIYEGHVVNGQPGGTYNDPNWNQGILRNADGRPLAYWFENQELMGLGKGTLIPASDVIHYRYQDGLSPRGIPALAHAIANIVDIIERRGFTKATIKLRAMLGLAIETAEGSKATGQMPVVGQLRTGPGSSPASRVGQVANGQDKGPKFEAVTMAGNTTSVATLAPGQSIKTLSDDSPNPNATEFENELLRDVAIGLQMPPQVIFWLEKQTGPMVRFTVRMAEKRIAERRAYARCAFLDRWIGYQLSLAIKAGNLEVPAAGLPDRWYACTWQEPASLTIDVGRDGNLELRQLDAGVASLDDVIGPAGGNWRETIAQKKREAEYLIEQAKELEAASGLSLDQCLGMLRTQGRAIDEIAAPSGGAAPPAP